MYLRNFIFAIVKKNFENQFFSHNFEGFVKVFYQVSNEKFIVCTIVTALRFWSFSQT